MVRRLSSILLVIIIVISLSPHNSYAAQQKNNSSFFLFFKQDILAYATGAANTNHVLAAQISPLPPTPLPTQQPTIVPTQTSVPSQPPVQPASLSTISTYLLNGVNEYRTSLGLSPVQSSAETCAFASTRAQEIASGFNHDGFNNRVANHTIPYSYWSHATENIAQAPNYQEVVTLWKNSPEHAANMRDNTQYVCIEQYHSFYAYEGMRP
jgi:uncharacterized protein YkwD